MKSNQTCCIARDIISRKGSYMRPLMRIDAGRAAFHKPVKAPTRP